MGETGQVGRKAGYPVEWFRPDLRRRLYKAWALGSVLVCVGATLGITLYHFHELITPGRIVTAFLAIAATAAGPLVVMRAAFKLLSDETVLILRNDGIAYTGPDQAFFEAWGDVSDIAYEAESDTLIVRTDAGSHHLARPHFMDVASPELVDRIRRVQRRALMGLLEDRADEREGSPGWIR